MNLWLLGYFDQSNQRIKEAIAIATDKKQFFVQGLCFLVNSVLSAYRNDIKACTKYTRACINIAKKYGHKQTLKEIEIYQGYLLLKKGNIATSFLAMKKMRKNTLTSIRKELT
jgi:hypothetical protein